MLKIKLWYTFLMLSLAAIFWPQLKDMPKNRQLVGAGEVIGVLYGAPLALAGLIALLLATNLQEVRGQWLMLLLMAALMLAFRLLGYFLITEIRAGRFASSDGSLESMMQWIALLLFGPTSLWIGVLFSIIEYIWRWRPSLPPVDRWSRSRNLALSTASNTLAPLAAFSLYRLMGGPFPLSDLTPRSIGIALLAMLVNVVLVFILWSGYIAFNVWAQVTLAHNHSPWPVIRFMALALALPSLAQPFGILAAVLYQRDGLFNFLFYMVGLLIVAFLSRRLSWAAKSQRQQSRMLEQLEEFSRSLINAPPDASTLPLLLREHVPGMFPSGRIAIWLAPDQLLLAYPFDWKATPELVWEWLKNQADPSAFRAQDVLPWTGAQSTHNAMIITPILNPEDERVLGGIYLELFSLTQTWDKESLHSLFPGVLSLASLIGSDLHQAEIYAQAMAYQKVSQELSLAGKIQASFLPDELPRLSGWQLAVTLMPARETSGDFFDLIPLANDKLGIVIADVTDKGMGAALYMALSRTLLRTYAIEFDTETNETEPQPEVVFFAANGRILQDARANLFVTTFYGVLDTQTGQLTYSNAGHNPPYLMRANHGADSPSNCLVEPLSPTGIPIGIEEDTLWEKSTVQLNPGDILVLYTDGITDAQNDQGQFFEDGSLQATIRSGYSLSAQEIQEEILTTVQEFVNGAPQFDDITLLVIQRDQDFTNHE